MKSHSRDGRKSGPVAQQYVKTAGTCTHPSTPACDRTGSGRATSPVLNQVLSPDLNPSRDQGWRLSQWA